MLLAHHFWLRHTASAALQQLAELRLICSDDALAIFQHPCPLACSDISFNRFSGPLPEFWNGLIILVVVSIEGNQFTGTIPPSWGTNGYYFNNTYNETQALEYL